MMKLITALNVFPCGDAGHVSSDRFRVDKTQIKLSWRLALPNYLSKPRDDEDDIYRSGMNHTLASKGLIVGSCRT